MSNRSEILEEYRHATSELTNLKNLESKSVHSSAETVTIEPKLGRQMCDLSDKCAQLNMILEAMDASED